ncbi:MAG: aminotransferase class I/II-fold pyridoxal phosphate-dependent enzyme [Devosiaceae bacterium]|nr:aminotransferase class I/II-fold pyridoxal phosphate-dependent enzyme [Devosiaceae bacterium]
MKNNSLKLNPFLALEIFAKATELEAQGKKIYHLEVGEPGGEPTKKIAKALNSYLKHPQKYTSAKGLIELREALSIHYQKKYGVEVNKENFIVTMGSSAGFNIALLSAFEKNATIAVTSPGYPAYINIINSLGFKATEIPLTEQNYWQLSAKDVAQAYKKQPFDGLLFASPANPTGACISENELEKIILVCKKLNILLISDEIYHGLEYGTPSKSALNFTNDAIVVNSFSKYFCMTGYRIGWLIMPKNLVKKAEMLQQNMYISAPTLSQKAAIIALDDLEHCDLQKAQYLRNRDILIMGLNEMGLRAIKPAQGAFYIYVDFSAFTNDTLVFCKEMLFDIGVALTPGEDFDRANGKKYVRISFAGKQSDIEIAIKKMVEYLTRP